MDTINSDMALFLWFIVAEPVIAAIAAAATFTVAIVIASYFNFLLGKGKLLP